MCIKASSSQPPKYLNPDVPLLSSHAIHRGVIPKTPEALETNLRHLCAVPSGHSHSSRQTVT